MREISSSLTRLIKRLLRQIEKVKESNKNRIYWRINNMKIFSEASSQAKNNSFSIKRDHFDR